jgi:hypothetical protein
MIVTGAGGSRCVLQQWTGRPLLRHVVLDALLCRPTPGAHDFGCFLAPANSGTGELGSGGGVLRPLTRPLSASERFF